MPDAALLHIEVRGREGEQRVRRIRVDVPPQGDQADHTIADICRRHELPLNTRCGQQGWCEGCLIELLHGRLRHRDDGTILTASGEPVTCRGCSYFALPGEEVVIRVPDRSLLAYAPQVVTSFRLNVPASHDPLLPTGARQVRTGMIGAAIDVGTTTVVVMLVDLADGRALAQAAAFNHQMHLADDVLTRINLCMTDPAMLDRMRQAVAHKTIMPLLRQAAHEAAVRLDDLATIVAAGNTTMLHLLAGVDPSPMGTAPFTPAFTDHRVLAARDVGLDVDAQLHLLPAAGAYVGADLVAGALATGLAYDDGPAMLVDIGTNGEILLKTPDRFVGCATAAGPAFEGAGLRCGLRAGHGAVSHVRMTAPPHGQPFEYAIDIIGRNDDGRKVHPQGVCGSAYVDFLAHGRRSGLLLPVGRFHPQPPPGAAEHLITDENGYGRAFVLAHGQGKRPIVVTENDLAALLQAKAAIAAGITTLLQNADLRPRDVKRLHLAGGFGMHIDVASAIDCGLLPGFVPDQVEVVGNTSLGGAYLTLLDRKSLVELTRIARGLEIIELNLDPRFESNFIDALSLPSG
jgi:uncharacterized 2Fe-2S/4Fe-4S cluster protein (DUF4445 family)